ncbi:MAG TPA: TetR/AcrR family transcriptional regulator [Chitinophagaceae bacterium]
MTTKEKILHASLKLFNAHGIDQVTVRDIAKEINISHGNLCYHYPGTNDIILALYNNLVTKISAILDALEPDENIVRSHAQATQNIFELLYSYKFFFLNFIEITRRIKSIKKTHYELIEQRKHQVRHFFEILRQEGVFRKDLSNEQYEFLIMQCFVYGDFWISNSEVMYKGPAAEKINYYVKGYLALFNPYFTEKGKSWAGDFFPKD